MGQRDKNTFNFRLIAFLGIFLFALLLFKEYLGSLYFQERDRITIGVYGPDPFVYSYNPTKKLGFVVQFDPEYEINVPGGYGWYKLGSIDLLGKIEHKRAELIRQSFRELIGSEVNYVFYPKKAVVQESTSGTLREKYLATQKAMASSSYTNSMTNWLDRLFLRRILNVREDRLVFINTADLYRDHKHDLRYDAELLDSRLKGLFYRDSFLNFGLKAIIVSKSSAYRSAQRILRLIEGMGVKVIEIEINNNLKPKHCQIEGEEIVRFALNNLAKTFGCRTRKSNSQIIRFVLDERLEKEFSYN